MQNKDITLQALETFHRVYQLRSFTSAADHLGVNQSAVSYTIDKLRKHFDDPLFYRQAGKVVPTIRGEQLAPQISALLGRIADLDQSTDFDPQCAHGEVTIACNYYERQVLIPLLVRHLSRVAPAIKLTIINAMHQGVELLTSAATDLLLGPSQPQSHDCYSLAIMDEHYTCVADPSFHHWQDHIPMADYQRAKHVTVNYGNQWRSPYLRALDQQGIKLNEVHEVPSLAGLDQMIAGTELISTVPNRIAQSYSGTLSRLTAPESAPFQIYASWTKRTHQSPMHRWLRDQIKLLCAHQGEG